MQPYADPTLEPLQQVVLWRLLWEVMYTFTRPTWAEYDDHQSKVLWEVSLIGGRLSKLTFKDYHMIKFYVSKFFDFKDTVTEFHEAEGGSAFFIVLAILS